MSVMKGSPLTWKNFGKCFEVGASETDERQGTVGGVIEVFATIAGVSALCLGALILALAAAISTATRAARKDDDEYAEAGEWDDDEP